MLTGPRWQAKIARQLQRDERSARARIARDEISRIRDLAATIGALHRDLADLVVMATAPTARRNQPTLNTALPRRPTREPESSPQPERVGDQVASEALDERGGRAWPRSRHRVVAAPELATDQIKGGYNYGSEP